jgi:hypothetical protein
MQRYLLAVLAGGLALTGCETVREARLGSELPGQTLRVELANGQTSMLRFNADGSVIGTGPGGQASGRWAVEGQRICLDWPRQGRECFPYARAFRRGETVSLTGTSGATVRVTLQ